MAGRGGKTKRRGSWREAAAVCAAAAPAALFYALAAGILGLTAVKGLPRLAAALRAAGDDAVWKALGPAVVSTAAVAGVSLLLAAPVSLLAAVHLVEKRGSRAAACVRFAARTLASVPSVVYGLFGTLLFVTTLGWGTSLLAGGATLALMILPAMLDAAESAMEGVPEELREASLGLGAGRMRTVLRVVLPEAAPGLLSGVILALGRVCGETAALMYTAGTAAGLPEGLLDSGRTLAVHLYLLAGETLRLEDVCASAAVLLMLVFGFNALAAFLAGKLGARR